MEDRTPNEAVADFHKALARGSADAASYGSSSAMECPPLQRSCSEGLVRDKEDAARLKTPGGFRRDYLHKKAEKEGVPPEERPLAWQQSLLETLRPLIRSGYVESMIGMTLDTETGQDLVPPAGRAGHVHTVVALVKSFIGSGITFTPSAFANGGWLLSSVVLACVGITSFVCVYLLLECRAHTKRSSYGEIAEMALGPQGRFMVQCSLVLSQFGVCIALMIFVSELAQSMGVKHMSAILGQLPVVVPLCMIRSVRHLEIPNLVADFLILSGLGVIIRQHVHLLLSHGIDTMVVACRPRTFGISIGTLIYIFEGIPMILPIRDAMQDPKSFFPLFSWVFLGISFFFWLFGLLGYLCLGVTAQTVVLLNLPPQSVLTGATRAAYMLALILSLPLMFLPAARITEAWVFGRMNKGQHAHARAWLRIMQVCTLALLARHGGPHFDRLLALIGAFCATPIAFVYPAMFHLRLCAVNGLWKAVDLGCIVFGVAAAVATLLFM